MEHVLSEDNTDFAFTFDNVVEQLFVMKWRMNTLEKKLSKVETECQRSSVERTPPVAFRTVLSKDLGSATPNQPLVFDQVSLNRGSGYNPRNGVFTAPYNGTYLFAMKLGNPTNKPAAFFLKKNGVGIEYVIAGHTRGWNVGGGTTVAELTVGDEIWVQGEGYISGAYSVAQYHTTFSGVLVNLDFP